MLLALRLEKRVDPFPRYMYYIYLYDIKSFFISLAYFQSNNILTENYNDSQSAVIVDCEF